MTIKIKKTYKYIKYLFGAYALYSLVGGFMKSGNTDGQDISPETIHYGTTIENVYADVPIFGDGGGTPGGSGGGDGSGSGSGDGSGSGSGGCDGGGSSCS